MDATPGGAPGRAAGHDDATLDNNPVRLLHRHVVQERLRLLFAPGARVLDLGPPAGDDASFLAARGVHVQAVGGREPTLAREEDRGAFDGAFSPLGVLSGSNLPGVGAYVASAVRPGGHVLLCLAGPSLFPALLKRALLGRGQPRGRSERGESSSLGPDEHRWPSDVRRILGVRFQWTCLLGLGILVPEHADWTRQNPQTFGTLAAIEGILRSWAGLRALGDHFVLEGQVVRVPAGTAPSRT